MPVLSDQAIANCYQPLFDLLQNEHQVTLIISEMDEIILAAEKVKKNLNENIN